jgi:hypothetical protein
MNWALNHKSLALQHKGNDHKQQQNMVEITGLLRCTAMQSGRKVPTLWRNLLHPTSLLFYPEDGGFRLF